MFEEDVKDFILARTENLSQNDNNWIEFERLNDIASNNSKLLKKLQDSTNCKVYFAEELLK